MSNTSSKSSWRLAIATETATLAMHTPGSPVTVYGLPAAADYYHDVDAPPQILGLLRHCVSVARDRGFREPPLAIYEDSETHACGLVEGLLHGLGWQAVAVFPDGPEDLPRGSDATAWLAWHSGLAAAS